jgi:surface polysaccharide O-acyltransferase-like enzyme
MPASTMLAVQEPSTSKSTGPRLVTAPTYNVSIGYLRAFITLLVVTHHAALAYHPYAPAAPASLVAEPRVWQAFPVVDAQRSTVFALLVGFNDIFFMALMFFVSGLFVWMSLQRKGAGTFLRDRTLRLGLPFVAAAAVVAPLAYYPTFLQSGAAGGFSGFWKQWLSLGNWPSGPAWFVWVLLAFDAVAAGLFLLLPMWGEIVGRISAGADRRPILFFVTMLLLSSVVYIPLAVAFNPFRWSAWGPFTFQTSRVLNYFLYFVLGIGVGAYGLQRGLLARDGKLARRWWLWCLAALVAFAIASGVGLAAMTAHLGSRSWEIAGDSGLVFSCAASSFAFLALFVRFANKRTRLFDSLNENAYGIYLVHYAFVSWLQLAVLKMQMPALAKGSLVFFGSVLLSWGTAALLRRIPWTTRRHA